jgi:high-affinity iron transporter
LLASLVLSLREGLEAALIIGIVLGVLNKIGRRDLIPVVWRAVMAAILLCLLAAITMQILGAEFEGRAEQIFEGTAMLSAAVLLTWMIFWMKRQANSMQSELAVDVQHAVVQRSNRPLFVLAFLAVGREGLELALFLTASTLTSSILQTSAAAVIGLIAAAGLGYLIFVSSRRLSLKKFFQVTNVLLILFAAGLVARSIQEFNEAGWVPVIIEHLWNMNPILNESSTLGQALGALFGYNSSPSLTSVVAYLGYYGLLWLFFYKFSHQSLAAERAKVPGG